LKRAAPLIAPSVTAQERRRIRCVLAQRLPVLNRLAAGVGEMLAGPDPEAALVFIRMLEDECRAATATALPRSR